MQPYSIFLPDIEQNGVLFNSPHSGTYLPDKFLTQISVDPSVLLYSGDILVDQLIKNTPLFGATGFINNFARIYVDTNRSADELDPEMFRDPDHKNRFEKTEKVDRGFGVISRKTYNGQAIYPDKLPASEISRRLNQVYHPVHKALGDLLTKRHQRCGYYILLDCHSMPSYGFIDPGLINAKQPDLIIGNCFNTSCSRKLTQYVADYFTHHGLNIAFNTPYSGGFNTQHYSKVEDNRNALQLEFNRALYLDEKMLKPNEGFSSLQALLTGLSENLNSDLDLLVQRKQI